MNGGTGARGGLGYTWLQRLWTEPASLRPAAERRTSDGGAERRITVASVPSAR